MRRTFISGTITTLLVVVLFSCENKMSEIQEITKEDTLPVVSAYDIDYIRTDSGHKQLVLKSPLMERYDGEDPYSVFPEGFEVTFFDTLGNATSFMRANYGISYTERKFMRARNNVVVKNFQTEEQLETENLVWDEKKKLIHSNTFVKISSPDKVVYGDSMRANETFSEREIFNFRGVLEVEEDSISD
jgi:LPS export ABC transporter protein LptC